MQNSESRKLSIFEYYTSETNTSEINTSEINTSETNTSEINTLHVLSEQIFNLEDKNKESISNEVITNEVSNTDIKINVETINIFNLISIIEKILKDNNLIIKLQLSEDSINIINTILKNHPNILNNISDDICKIINDKIIDIYDIPEIILLIKDSINLYSSLNDLKLTKEQIINFIKNIVILIIESDEIKINEDNKNLIINLINMSVKLLESEINFKKTLFCKCF